MIIINHLIQNLLFIFHLGKLEGKEERRGKEVGEVSRGRIDEDRSRGKDLELMEEGEERKVGSNRGNDIGGSE